MIRLILTLSRGTVAKTFIFVFSPESRRILCREPFINRISLRNINVHAQLPVGREKKKRISERD